jgi:hypothetical protein
MENGCAWKVRNNSMGETQMNATTSHDARQRLTRGLLATGVAVGWHFCVWAFCLCSIDFAGATSQLLDSVPIGVKLSWKMVNATPSWVPLLLVVYVAVASTLAWGSKLGPRVCAAVSLVCAPLAASWISMIYEHHRDPSQAQTFPYEFLLPLLGGAWLVFALGLGAGRLARTTRRRCP